MPVKGSCCCENCSLSNYVETLSGDQDDRRHAGTLIVGIFKSLCNVEYLGSKYVTQNYISKIKVSNHTVREKIIQKFINR